MSDPMLELVICDAVANRMSFYHAAEGDSWRNERAVRDATWAVWLKCRNWLDDQGLLKDFMRSGGYLT